MPLGFGPSCSPTTRSGRTWSPTSSGAADGPTLCFLGHVDTVLADPADWQRGPWSGDVEDGYLWGRGSIDMKSQVAAEAVAAVTLARARAGGRPGAA